MTQPSYVPIAETDQVRPAYRLKVPSVWTQSRPSELLGTTLPRGERFGAPGPDQGYAIRLARRFEDRLVLGGDESLEDAVIGCTAVGMRRCARFGRAPAVYDLEFAFTLWGFLGGAPPDLLEARAPLFRGVAHHYAAQRVVAAAVNEDALALPPQAVARRLGRWPELITLPVGD